VLARRAFLAAAAAAPLHAEPLPSGFAADFDPAAAVWLSHAPGHEAITRGLANALQAHVRLRFLVPDAASADAVRPWVQAPADIVVEPAATYFLRDVAVFTRGPAIVDFHASQYGAAAWCERRWPQASDRAACRLHARTRAAEHDALDRLLAARMGWPLHATTLALEGGAFEVNGRGVVIANEELHRTRNPGLSRAEVERELRRLPGIRKVIWLTAGLAEDVHLRGTIAGPYVAWGAGGHTDQFVRFADERTVLLAWPDEDHPVARLSRHRMRRNLAVLSTATDADGRRLRVVKVPMPRIVQRRVMVSAAPDNGASEHWSLDHFAPHESRRVGDALWQVATASYLNFVVANGAVVLPDFVPHGTPPALQARVKRLFERVFPGRRVSFVNAITAHWVGGGPHCATLNQP
jgi:agmatine deiminase